jgi:cell wall-associated NlpC family hydrolase
MKKIFYMGLTLLFFVFTGNVFAQTIQFEYDVSQKYPIYITFEGNVNVAAEMTGWFYDNRNWHYVESEWTWVESAGKYKYSGPDKNNWIKDGGEDFYMGPDDSARYYAYLQNTAKDWEMFMMNAGDKNVIYATGNEIFDRIDGTPSNSNPYKGTWRSRADNTLVAIFDETSRNGETGTCKLTFTNQYTNPPLAAKAPPPAAKTPDAVVIRAISPSNTSAPSALVKPTVVGTDATRNAIIETAKKYLGKRYELGSTGMNTFDCSGFTQTVYKQAANITVPRPCSKIQKECKPIKINELKVGDLVLFDTGGHGAASHVAIYMGNDEIIHSYDGIPSIKREGVKITKLQGNSYWKRKAMFGVRILAD